MQLAMVGMGRMGGRVQRLLQVGHQVVVFDRSAEAVQAHVGMGANGAKDPAPPNGYAPSARQDPGIASR
jgi:6-phosphogluconate dehydrogenase